ncbi:MAG: hypothetical protein DIU58_010920 [Sphaerobacter thermophilus]|uniref:Cysteine dioxygenase type I n=1 Tax=Sphaerobacter thermophilus (strain ATCC 49802 / DSM 20745 / KCCM 41009 / NCIMB 13125 / S 6022) TaxID=479434 RepID=D1C7Z5_SPHTD|nr:hypothetical protein [Sphaerobacter thermophilus]ACZ39866.1 conserved hypothetical protein [Sphaerobacter thermophilus DSM 20745]PZN59731.1 MAG: hypothetical protein DIU58_17460 [Sphaerobacter thermophilus]
MTPQEPTADEYYVDSPVVREFIAAVQAARAAEPDPARLVEQLRPAFSRLLQTDGWLPDEFARPYEASGMGGGIGQYLLYRSADRSLSLFSLVVPAGSTTPVHDHLAWGLVGLYRGEQLERVYAPIATDYDAGQANLELIEERTVRAGEFYTLLPPTDDIHSVTTTSSEASISIHLLGNDTGCVVRHRFDPETASVTPFRSGYSNVPCEDQARS